MKEADLINYAHKCSKLIKQIKTKYIKINNLFK
jgi:hypothetical protein